ncbi:unnamed protein product [Didymodactylos carnosus]|uniref:LTD domain-containing protein n=1 Tax=Didymodactylos carnosus TaxID=1234261 RepID=A0A814DR01_9BILA|nr:unnamed protein product [Didymodactylos carnosus]CAF0961785.1 unnamed protein product [Didymodactylos carnosus]CAF3662037.1 unnamed protein product [Didymodactylos carnosus]CAF3736317.1 unnamed protein product [Didymodactylos carnosus]
MSTNTSIGNSSIQLNNININEDHLLRTTLFRRRSKGPVMFNGCSPHGDVIIIDNISSKKTYDLSNWLIERQVDSKPKLFFDFPSGFIIPPQSAVELWASEHYVHSNKYVQEKNDDGHIIIRVQTKMKSWNEARDFSITKLFDASKRERAVFTHRTLTEESVNYENDTNLKSFTNEN